MDRLRLAFGGFQQQVVVIVHQHVGVNPYPKTIRRFGQQLQEMKPVGVIPIDVLALVAASGDMMRPPDNLDA